MTSCADYADFVVYEKIQADKPSSPAKVYARLLAWHRAALTGPH